MCPNEKFSFVGKTLIGNGELPRTWVAISDTAYQNRRTKHILRIMDKRRVLVLDRLTDREWTSLRSFGWEIERVQKSEPLLKVK